MCEHVRISACVESQASRQAAQGRTNRVRHKRSTESRQMRAMHDGGLCIRSTHERTPFASFTKGSRVLTQVEPKMPGESCG